MASTSSGRHSGRLGERREIVPRRRVGFAAGVGDQGETAVRPRRGGELVGAPVAALGRLETTRGMLTDRDHQLAPPPVGGLVEGRSPAVGDRRHQDVTPGVVLVDRFARGQPGQVPETVVLADG